jgi:broad specificity phosphatase PhoE
VNSTQITFENKVPIIIDKRLRECNYRTFNAKASSIVEPMQEKCIIKKFPKGESYEDVKIRIEEFLKDIKKKYDGKHVAIVAHKAPQLALDVILKNRTWKRAFDNDWRKKKAWQPGWGYILK